ncbi:ABC transporter ATP-binding protein [Peribacillus frigoritolerans]|uniref:ABC transporter ATP-binding protein n=1 Tax=Peribacillus frigoritolerans TaxID=450367 RepID=A0AAJ1QJ14_9BACI|nr:ABC transporter ATP-binding protein [Peribacillus frigoritolerans]MCD1162720.1 ABC transporter ATP-binding protein/permease [Peribacillus castrilensis]MDM5282296.1 ABC transporter ATP-binding protein [Peribacillus frigoritolerans]
MSTVIKRFLNYYKPYKRLFIIDFSCAVLIAVLELVFPLAVNRIIDDLLPTNNWKYIIIACAALLAIYLLSTLLNFIVSYYGHKLGINIETDLRENLFSKLQKQSFKFFDNNKTGHLVSRMTNDLMDIGEIAHHGPEDLFIAFMTIFGAFFVMFQINWQLAIIVFTVVPFLIVLSVYFSRKMTRAFKRMFGDIANYNARIENNISGIRVVQSFTKEAHEIQLFNRSNSEFRLTKLMAYKIMAWSTSMNFILMKLVALTVLGCGAWYVIHGKMTYGEFVAFIMLSNIFIAPIKQISSILETLPKGYAGFKRYLELVDMFPDIHDVKDAIEVDSVKGDVVFENVSFGYEADRTILKDISFSVTAGNTIALVGASGGGKTTLCSLLPRFYDIQSGSIKIDGIDIRDYKLTSLRKHIGIVQQDVFLFDGTIRDNIMYGNTEATEAQLYQAIEDAQLNDLIEQLPEGLETLIGERGVKLSGGQKQRVSIARIFLKNPPILILDEATSALDTETEKAVQKALERLSINRTTLVIAHRLATIKHADRIIVVQNGEIIEQGAHDNLLHQDGAYKNLILAQTV